MYTIDSQNIDKEKLIGNCPVVELVMNDVPVICLIDPGSQVITITESFYKLHLRKSHSIQDCSSYIKLMASNGSSIPISGLLIVDITLYDNLYKDVHLLVVKDSVNPQNEEQKV